MPSIVSKIGTFFISLSQKHKVMEEKARFNVIYMDEAIKFLESLDMKARNKIAYNIGKSNACNRQRIVQENGRF